MRERERERDLHSEGRRGREGGQTQMDIHLCVAKVKNIGLSALNYVVCVQND